MEEGQKQEGEMEDTPAFEESEQGQNDNTQNLLWTRNIM